MDRQAELRRRHQADRHIATAEKNVTEQRVQIDKLRHDGHDVELAEKTLKAFEEVLITLQEHREIIIRTIEEIDQGII